MHRHSTLRRRHNRADAAERAPLVPVSCPHLPYRATAGTLNLFSLHSPKLHRYLVNHRRHVVARLPGWPRRRSPGQTCGCALQSLPVRLREPHPVPALHAPGPRRRYASPPPPVAASISERGPASLTATAARDAWSGPCSAAHADPSPREPRSRARSTCGLGQSFSIGVADSLLCEPARDRAGDGDELGRRCRWAWALLGLRDTALPSGGAARPQRHR